MTEAVKLKEVKKPERALRIKFEAIGPAHIVDSWRLHEKSLVASKVDLSKTNPVDLRCHLFTYLTAPTFVGLMMRIGRRPIGQFLGHLEPRQSGAAIVVRDLWVDPTFRGQGLGKSLISQVLAQAKKAGATAWEMNVSDETLERVLKRDGTRKLFTRVGGPT